MKLYESGEDYLEAVLMLQKKNGFQTQLQQSRSHFAGGRLPNSRQRLFSAFDRGRPGSC